MTSAPSGPQRQIRLPLHVVDLAADEVRTAEGAHVELRPRLRGHNRWKSAEQCGHHPHPGTHPMVVTTERDWGGRRVPGAEYDLDSYRIERQAEVIVRAPLFMKLLEEFVEHAEQEPENLSDDMIKLAQIARRIISEVSG